MVSIFLLQSIRLSLAYTQTFSGYHLAFELPNSNWLVSLDHFITSNLILQTILKIAVGNRL